MSITTLLIDGREYIVIPKEEYENRPADPAALEQRRREKLHEFFALAGQDLIDPQAIAELREASRT